YRCTVLARDGRVHHGRRKRLAPRTPCAGARRAFQKHRRALMLLAGEISEGRAMGAFGIFRRLAAAFLLLWCAACASDRIAEGPPVPQGAVLQEYRLGPGDQLRINVFGIANLSGQFAVSPSGTIAYPLVGDVPVQGKTV